jgi:L-alanine-DL-glutamate epimerase-like enolase superfamily enzyme
MRDALLAEPLDLRDGYLYPPATPGLGVQLTDELRRRFAWREGGGARMRVD